VSRIPAGVAKLSTYVFSGSRTGTLAFAAGILAALALPSFSRRYRFIPWACGLGFVMDFIGATLSPALYGHYYLQLLPSFVLCAAVLSRLLPTAPLAADRFYNLVKNGFYNESRFFRVLDGFMAQFGISGDPRITASWRERRIPDDRGKQSNTRGTLTFANAGPGTRTSQLFINYRDNAQLDPNFAPIGKVVEGMAVVDSLYSGYGEGAPSGNGPEQERVMTEGETYLAKNFPKLDRINKAEIIR